MKHSLIRMKHPIRRWSTSGRKRFSCNAWAGTVPTDGSGASTLSPGSLSSTTTSSSVSAGTSQPPWNPSAGPLDEEAATKKAREIMQVRSLLKESRVSFRFIEVSGLGANRHELSSSIGLIEQRNKPRNLKLWRLLKATKGVWF